MIISQQMKENMLSSMMSSFFEGELSFRVQNEDEYYTLLKQIRNHAETLPEVGSELTNFLDNPLDFDPNYQFFFMKKPEYMILDAFSQYETVVRESNEKVQECIEVKKMEDMFISKEPEKQVPPALQMFLDGDMVLRIQDEYEYKDFINQLREYNVELSNLNADFESFIEKPEPYDYNYPYFFIQNPNTMYMENRGNYENIVNDPATKVYGCMDYSYFMNDREQNKEQEKSVNELQFEELV